MFILLCILMTIGLGFAVGATCHLAVLSAVIRREGWKAATLASLVPPYLFYRGWKNADRLQVAGWMKMWTAASAMLVMLATFLQVQMG
jgi:predicted HAD superfamily phosphohydrolase